MHQTLLCLRDYLIVVDAKEETQDGRGKKEVEAGTCEKRTGGIKEKVEEKQQEREDERCSLTKACQGNKKKRKIVHDRPEAKTARVTTKQQHDKKKIIERMENVQKDDVLERSQFLCPSSVAPRQQKKRSYTALYIYLSPTENSS